MRFIIYTILFILALVVFAFAAPPKPLPLPTAVCSVVDSVGQLVGEKSDCYAAIRKINGTWVYIPVSRNGILKTTGTAYFTDVSCQGQRYLFSSLDNSMIEYASWFDGQLLHYPSGVDGINAEQIQSYSSSDGSSPCRPISFTSPYLLTGETTVDVSTFGLVPPFTLK